MNVDCRRVRRWAKALVVVVATVATPPLGAAAAEPTSSSAPTEPEPRCHRDEDLACTLVRETSIGVWVWTERFRPGQPGSSGWTLDVGAGPVSSVPTVHFVTPPAPTHTTTANDSPILE